MPSNNWYSKIPKTYLNDVTYYNPNASKIHCPLHPFRMLICGAAGSGKTNCMMNIINDCNNFEHIYLFGGSLDQPLYKFLIDKMEAIGKKIGKKIITYSDDVKDIPKSTDFDKNIQNLVIIDDMILEKNLKSVEELYVRGRHNSVSVAFLSQSYHAIPKIIRLNTGYLILRGIESIKDFRLITSNYALGETGDQLYKMYKEATKEPMAVFMIDLISTVPSMRYRTNYKPMVLSSLELSKMPKKVTKIV